MKFWNRYQGDCYSHISLSLDPNLAHMMSFARKKINNPFISGLVVEDIGGGLFAKCPKENKIAVMKIDITKRQYIQVERLMNVYWNRRTELRYSFAGLFSMLLYGKGVNLENHYFCSQWVDEVLKRCGLDFFKGKCSYNIRPFDFYSVLKDHIEYEGLTANYFDDCSEVVNEFVCLPRTAEG